MKTYFVECTVYFTDTSSLPTWNVSETYTRIVTANSLKIAEKKAELDSLADFKNDLGSDFENIHTVIEQSYETTADARCSKTCH